MKRFIILGMFMLFSHQALGQCTDAPLSTTPTGPTWSMQIERFDDVADFTFWRNPCSQSEADLLLTMEPIEGAPFVCGVHFDVVQGGTQFDNFRPKQDPDLIAEFCGDLLVTTTVYIDQSTFSPNWDDQGAFTAFFRSDFSVEVGAYRYSDYTGGGEPTQPTLQGGLSGSWYDPARAGEGFVLEFAESSAGRALTVYWFTHREGQPYWLIGTTSYQPGATEVTVDLLEVSGTGFGEQFDPDEVQTDAWGAISLEFDSCSSGTAAWSHNGALGSGSFDLERITSALDGVACD